MLLFMAVCGIHPNIIINAATLAVDKAETDSDLAHAVNAVAMQNLAQIACEKARGCYTIHRLCI